MSTQAKEALSKWVPILITVLINVVTIGYWGGRIEARVTSIENHAHDEVVHMPLAKKFETFVPRTELTAMKSSRDLEIAEMKSDNKAAFFAINAKLDRLIERGALGSKN